MKKGDTVIYIFDPYEKHGYPLEGITVAELTREEDVGFLDKDPAIKPIKALHGKTSYHAQVAMIDYLYPIGDHEVITKIFIRGVE